MESQRGEGGEKSLTMVDRHTKKQAYTLEKVKYISSGSRIFTLACLGPRYFCVSERVLYQMLILMQLRQMCGTPPPKALSAVDEFASNYIATNPHVVDVAQHSEPFPSSSKAINNNFNNSSSSSTNQTHNKLIDLLPSNSDSANADFIDVAQHSASFHSSLNTTSTVLNNAATSLINEGTFPTTNENIMAILQTILQKNIDLEFRLTKIEEKLPELAEVMAIYKVMRDSKVLIKKTHKIVCRISGETENDTHTELSIVMPLTSLDSVYDIEKKLDSDDYQESMKSYIFMLKGALSDIIGVMRKLFSDNVLFNFNWDGVQGKRSLSKLKLVNSVFFDVFKLQGRINFEDSMRRCLTLSHNRHKQRRYLINKSSSATA
ncbi:uncharacterized protein [Eurosta solidaginis]